jgi:hypothetical protein
MKERVLTYIAKNLLNIFLVNNLLFSFLFAYIGSLFLIPSYSTMLLICIFSSAAVTWYMKPDIIELKIKILQELNNKKYNS